MPSPTFYGGVKVIYKILFNYRILGRSIKDDVSPEWGGVNLSR